MLFANRLSLFYLEVGLRGTKLVFYQIDEPGNEVTL